MNYKQIASFIRQRGQGFIPDKIEIFCKYLAGWLAGWVMFLDRPVGDSGGL